MIKCTTDCKKCVHEHVCKNEGNPKMLMDKLKHTQFGTGPNDDYGWDVMAEHYHVDITLSCPNYDEAKPLPRGGNGVFGTPMKAYTS